MAESLFPPCAPWADDSPLTPKIHNKRRSSSLSCDNSFDCQSLQRSLKRVRLTSNISPGELRLQRDLRHAVINHQWTPISEDEWTIPYLGEQRTSVGRRDDQDDFMQDTPAQMDDASNVEVTVARDEQDSMELILRIVVHVIPMTTTTTTLHLQFPRRYPHRPPVVRRIEHHQPLNISSCTASRWMAGNLTNSNWNNSPCAVPKLSRIVISASPDCALDASSIVASPETVVLTDWSPVSRLTDICEWLIAAVLNHGSSEQSTPTASNCSLMPVEGFGRSKDQDDVDEKKDDDDDYYGSYWGYAPSFPLNSSDRATEKSSSDYYSSDLNMTTGVAGELNCTLASALSSHHHRFQSPIDVTHAVHKSFFPPNRFDLGYERPIQLRQQDSMDYQYDD